MAKETVTTEEAAEILGRSWRQIMRLRAKRVLQPLTSGRPGKALLFHRRDVECLLPAAKKADAADRLARVLAADIAVRSGKVPKGRLWDRPSGVVLSWYWRKSNPAAVQRVFNRYTPTAKEVPSATAQLARQIARRLRPSESDFLTAMIALCLDFRLAPRKATWSAVAKALRRHFDAQVAPEEDEVSWQKYDQAYDALISGDLDAWKVYGDKVDLSLVGRHGRARARTVPTGKDIADMLGWNRQRARRACIQIRALPRDVLQNFFAAMGWQDRSDVPRMFRVRDVKLLRIKSEPIDENDIAAILDDEADRKSRGGISTNRVS